VRFVAKLYAHGERHGLSSSGGVDISFAAPGPQGSGNSDRSGRSTVDVDAGCARPPGNVIMLRIFNPRDMRLGAVPVASKLGLTAARPFVQSKA